MVMVGRLTPIMGRSLVAITICLLVCGIVNIGSSSNGVNAEHIARNEQFTSSVWNHGRAHLRSKAENMELLREQAKAHAHARYQSPESGNVGSAVPTTAAEIDENAYEWTHDRPLSELFFFPLECSKPAALNISTVCTIHYITSLLLMFV
jgi:hypothetical protein